MHLKNVKVADLASVHVYHEKSQSSFNQSKRPDKDCCPHGIKLFLGQIKAFTEKTSCHGVNRITDQQSPNNWFHWKNVLWMCLTLCSLGMACQSLATILHDYSNYPTTTLISHDYEYGGEFPSITFCNLNLFMPDRFPDYSTYDQYFDQVLAPSRLSASELRESKLESFFPVFGSFSEEEKKAYGHSIQDMLVDCEFAGVTCTVDDFYWTYDPHLGNCYSFNFGLDASELEQTIRTTRATGKGSGLTLTLDTHSDRYLEMTREIGISFMTHRSHVFPYIKEKGMVASPGFLTSIGLSKEQTILAEPPYGVCLRSGSDGNRRLNMFASKGYRYTSKTCQWSCEQAHVIQACGCCDRNVPCNPDGLSEAFGVTFSNDGTLSNCNSSDWRNTNCIVQTTLTNRASGVCTKQCYPECESDTYHSKYSLAAWPNIKQVEDIFTRINGSGRLLERGDVDGSSNISAQQMHSFVRDTVVRLDFHFVTLSKTITTTRPTYTWNLLLSNVGGQLGLWLGFSILTGFEIVEVIFDSIVFGVQVICRWKKESNGA